MTCIDRLRSMVGVIAFGTTLCVADAASAQSTTLDAFRPAPSPRDGFALSSAETNGRLRLDAQLYLDYANDPLVYEDVPGNPSTAIPLVRHQLALHTLVSLTARDRVLAFVGLPVNAVMNGDSPGARPAFAADGAGLGDILLGARVRVFGDGADGFTVAAQGTLHLPTSQYADGVHYAGDATIRLHAQVLGQYRLDFMRLSANLGAMFRGSQDFGSGLEVGQQFTFAIGATVPLLDDRIALLAEFDGTTGFGDFFDREHTAFEFLAGGRYFHDSGLSVGVGAGPGLARGFGSPDVRVLGTVAFSREFRGEGEVRATAASDRDGDSVPDATDACPDVAEDVDSFEDDDGCVDADNDRDGVADLIDSCPGVPEDADSFEDEDGCVDPDNDRDGVADTEDACVNEAEDVDTFEDADGCPDTDDDGDTVLDASDRCPREAGVVSNQGCPEPDRDGDTVLDRLDNCPDVAGPVENQGCAVRQQVRIEEGRLVILEAVFFRSNSDVIEARSFGLLDNVAAVIAAHPEIARVRIEGHTDARGNHDRNVRLSQARAESVMRYLVEHGIDASRLRAQGFGPDRPIVPNARSNADHARNRRVEFDLEDPAADATAPTDATPSP